MDYIGVNNEFTYYHSLPINLGGSSNHFTVYINSLLPAVLSECPEPVICCPVYIFRPPKFSNTAAALPYITVRIFAPVNALSRIQGMSCDDVNLFHKCFSNVRDFEYASLCERTYPYDHFCHIITLGMTCFSTVFERALPVHLFQDVINSLLQCCSDSAIPKNFCKVDFGSRSSSIRPITRQWLARLSSLTTMLKQGRIGCKDFDSWVRLVSRLAQHSPLVHCRPNDRLVVFLTCNRPLPSLRNLFLHAADSRDVPILRKGWLKGQKRWFYPMRRPGLSVASHAKRLVYMNTHFLEASRKVYAGLFGQSRRGRPRKVLLTSRKHSTNDINEKELLPPIDAIDYGKPSIVEVKSVSQSTENNSETHQCSPSTSFSTSLNSDVYPLYTDTCNRKRGRPKKALPNVSRVPKKRGRPRKEHLPVSLEFQETTLRSDSTQHTKHVDGMDLQDAGLSHSRISLSLLNSIYHGIQRRNLMDNFLSKAFVPAKRARGRPRKEVAAAEAATLEVKKRGLSVSPVTKKRFPSATAQQNHDNASFMPAPTKTHLLLSHSSACDYAITCEHVTDTSTSMLSTSTAIAERIQLGVNCNEGFTLTKDLSKHPNGTISMTFSNPALPSIWWPKGDRKLNSVNPTKAKQSKISNLISSSCSSASAITDPSTKLVWSFTSESTSIDTRSSPLLGASIVPVNDFSKSTVSRPNALATSFRQLTCHNTFTSTNPSPIRSLLSKAMNDEHSYGRTTSTNSVSVCKSTDDSASVFNPTLPLSGLSADQVSQSILSSSSHVTTTNPMIAASQPAQIISSFPLVSRGGQPFILCCPQSHFSNICMVRNKDLR